MRGSFARSDRGDLDSPYTGGKVAAKKAAGAARTRNMKPFYTALAVIAIVGVGAIVYSQVRGGEPATQFVDMTQLAEGNALVDQAQGIAVGSADAPVQILV